MAQNKIFSKKIDILKISKYIGHFKNGKNGEEENLAAQFKKKNTRI